MDVAPPPGKRISGVPSSGPHTWTRVLPYADGTSRARTSGGHRRSRASYASKNPLSSAILSPRSAIIRPSSLSTIEILSERPMDDQDPALGLVHLLRAVTVELDLFAAEFAGNNGLHPTDVRALIQLLDADRAAVTATPGWLAAQLGLNSASTTALIDRLERLGLVRRARDTHDRRRVLLCVEERAVALSWSFFGPLINGMVTA